MSKSPYEPSRLPSKGDEHPNPMGIRGIDGDRINELVAIAIGAIGEVLERGIVVEPTIWGRKFPIIVRLGEEQS